MHKHRDRTRLIRNNLLFLKLSYNRLTRDGSISLFPALYTGGEILIKKKKILYSILFVEKYAMVG